MAFRCLLFCIFGLDAAGKKPVLQLTKLFHQKKDGNNLAKDVLVASEKSTSCEHNLFTYMLFKKNPSARKSSRFRKASCI
jgi:hypothetical protein